MAKSPAKPKSAKPRQTKAEKEAIKADIERIKNTREYPELIGLMAVAPYKAVATLDWANDHLPMGTQKLEKFNKKDKETFAIALIKNGSARTAIDNLKNAPARKWKTLFSELAGVTPKKAEEKVKALKPKEFALFCEINSIPVVRSGAKQSVSKPKTLPKLLEKLNVTREYLKL